MTRDLRVGVIGFGLAGRIFHSAVIAATPGLELACIVQRRGDEAAQAHPDVQICRSIEEMLRDNSIRLVVVATPSYSHFEIAMHCLYAGRNVLIDKPFTLTSDEARQLIDEARKHGVLVTAYQNRRWDGDFVTLQQVLASGELGRVVSYESHFDRFREAPRLDVWRESGGPGGGILFDLGSHLIDQAAVLFGNPESVWADVRIDRDGGAVDDAFDVLLKFDGVTALLRSTLTAATPGPRFVVHGTKGSFVKWGLDPQEDALKAGAKFDDPGFGEEPESHWGELHVAGEPVRKIKTAAGDYRGIYANVRDAVLGKAKLEVTPEQAWRTTRLIELARLSSGEGRRLRFKH
ncbi:MAG TPA: Gfo/Idh/MocA family oxidoreductase [Acidobacteriaceae bacterium]|jgi:predicted dehydrogenase|nr:Gfo/Idh/MocA family oxidoreductase [Acidobacteriaceae bacterium]